MLHFTHSAHLIYVVSFQCNPCVSRGDVEKAWYKQRESRYCQDFNVQCEIECAGRSRSFKDSLTPIAMWIGEYVGLKEGCENGARNCFIIYAIHYICFAFILLCVPFYWRLCWPRAFYFTLLSTWVSFGGKKLMEEECNNILSWNLLDLPWSWKLPSVKHDGAIKKGEKVNFSLSCFTYCTNNYVS